MCARSAPIIYAHSRPLMDPQMTNTIEDIILQQDKRGVAELRPHLPPDFCSQAAAYTMEHPGDVVITTGYYITMSGGPETDGPPGAIAIGRALQALGRRVSYVTDSYTVAGASELGWDRSRGGRLSHRRCGHQPTSSIRYSVATETGAACFHRAGRAD